MAFDGYLSFGGIELINALRTTEYVKHLIPQMGLVRNTTIYDTLAAALGDEPYRTPFLDGADWVEPNETTTNTVLPRNTTHRFLGLYPLEIQGLHDSTMTATVVESILDGGYVNAQRDSTRAVRVHGILLGEDQLAAEAGLAWLRNALRSNGCSMHDDMCGYSDLRYFLASPDVCNPRWTQDYHSGDTLTGFGTLTPDTSPLVQTILGNGAAQAETDDFSGMPLGTTWGLPLTDGVIVRWGALDYSGPDVLEEHGPLYLRRSNFILNPSFTVDNSNWTAASGTITRVAPGYGHADQTSPVTYRNNWVPDPSFENGDPNLTGWRGSSDIVQTTDGTAPNGTKVAVVAPTVGTGATWLETTMLGPFNDGVVGSLSFHTHDGDDITITVHDMNGMQVYSGSVTGISSGWQSVSKENEIPMKQGYVLRIATDGAHELRVDAFLLEDSPTNLTFFDGDTAAGGGTTYYYVGDYTGPSRGRTGTYTSFSVSAAETDAPFGSAVLQFKMRATQATPSVLVELLDHADTVVGSLTVNPTTAFTRYALGVDYGRNIRPRFTSATGAFDIDDVMLEAGSDLNDYFDGHSTAPTDYTLYWVSAADSSISRMDWTGSAHIDRATNYRPFLYVDQGSLQGITLAYEVASIITMDDQLTAYARTLHQVTCTTGVSVIKNYDLEYGAAIEVDFTLTAGVPFAFGNPQYIQVDPDFSDTGYYSDNDVNIVSNGSGEYGTTGWTATPGTSGTAAITNPTATTTYGTKVIACTWSVATTAVSGGLYIDVPVNAANPYYFKFSLVRPSINQRLQAQIQWRTASTDLTVDTGTPAAFTANVAQSLNVSGIAPTGAVTARISVGAVVGTGSANWSIGSSLVVDGVFGHFRSISLPGFEYFDGDTADTSAWTYSWDGTVGASTSRRVAAIPAPSNLVDPTLPVIPSPPTAPAIANPAFAVGNEWLRYAVYIEEGETPVWAVAVPTLTITSTTVALHNVRIRVTANPFDRHYVPPPDGFGAIPPFDYCAEFIVSYLPPNSTITVDGVTNRAWASVAGAPTAPANQLLYGTGGVPMTWPELSCGIPYVMTIDVPPSGITLGTDLGIQLMLSRRE